MKKLVSDSELNASVPFRTLVIQIIFLLFVPIVFLVVGVRGQLGCSDIAPTNYPFAIFIALGSLGIVFLTPFALSLKQVSLDQQQIFVRSLFRGSRTILVSELYSVDVSFSSPVIVSVKLFDGSKFRYIPRTIGFFDVTEPTLRLIKQAKTNRKNA